MNFTKVYWCKRPGQQWHAISHNAPIKVMPHYPPSGQMQGYLTVIELNLCPRGGDIDFCNKCLNRRVWLTGLMVDKRTHPCEVVFTTKESSFIHIACSYHEYVADVHQTGDLMTFELEFCPKSGVIDCKVVKSPPMTPSVPGWGEVGPYFDRCII